MCTGKINKSSQPVEINRLEQSNVLSPISNIVPVLMGAVSGGCWGVTPPVLINPSVN
jgi:hypothetical protein